MAEVTQAEYEEMKRIVTENVCAICGAELQIRTNPEKRTLEVGCIDRSHHGYIEKQTYTEAHRRGILVPSYIEDKIKQRMLPEKADLDRIIALVATRFPRADLDHPSAATFIMDCWRLDLDPLLGEVVPVTFKSRRKIEGVDVEKKVVTPVITEDGYLSMAARGCPDKWAGPPRVEPVTDEALKEQICNDPKAWVWKATGRTKDMEPGQESFAYGWVKTSEIVSDESKQTPKDKLPGNQARVRAIKRWVRENFPEARHKMIEMTQEWMSRAEGVKEAQDIIDAEYRILGMPQLPGGDGDEGEKGVTTPKASMPALMTEPQRTFLLRLGKERLNMSEDAMQIVCRAHYNKGLDELTTREASEWIDQLRTQPQGEKETPAGWDRFWQRCRELGLTADDVHSGLGVKSVKDWLNAGKTLDEALEVLKNKAQQTQPKLME